MGTTSLTLKVLLSHIRHATLHRKPITVTDSEVRGLSARISPTGRVTWVASKSIGRGRGSTQRVVVGHYPGMNLDQARIEAGHTISRLAKGEDVVSQVKAANHWLVVCATDHSETPEPLRGEFTDLVEAKKAINSYLEKKGDAGDETTSD